MNGAMFSRSHPCSVELSYGNVYCYECGDYVYNSDLETISEAAFDKLVTFLKATSLQLHSQAVTMTNVKIVSRTKQCLDPSCRLLADGIFTSHVLAGPMDSQCLTPNFNIV